MVLKKRKEKLLEKKWYSSFLEEFNGILLKNSKKRKEKKRIQRKETVFF